MEMTVAYTVKKTGGKDATKYRAKSGGKNRVNA